MGLLDLITGTAGAAISPVSAVATAAAGIIDKFFPDKTQLEKDAAALELQQVMNQFNLTSGQIDVDKIEAGSTNWFVAGWRPYVGWVCGTGLAYQFIFMPIMNGLIVAIFNISAPFVSLDTSTLLTCLGGMLGLGTLRTVEKQQGVESRR